MNYKLDGSRITLREFWWETKLFFWVGILVKLMKIRIRGSTDDLAVDSLVPLRVDQSSIAPEMLARFTPVLQQLQAIGFTQPPLWHSEENVLQATRNTLATLLHDNGRTWVRVQCRTNFGRVPAKIKFFTTFISKTPGVFIATGNGKYDMAWPPTHEVLRFRNLEVNQLWPRHQKRMTQACQTIPRDQLPAMAEQYHTTLRDFHIARGVFQPLEEEELALLQQPAPMVAQLAPKSTAEAPVAGALAAPVAVSTPLDLMEIATLDELRRLQNKKVNWRSSIALLVISAIFFVVISHSSDIEQDWQYVGIVAGILLFHELGHYLAMRIFGYRNLRMFFIPGFGAAVSGRHYNAPAWKKIIVSLMGPLPGIAAGIVALLVSLYLHNDLLYRIGLFAIIINVFNLIPILPFDGGWVAHAALFSRHPKLDVGFRLVAALLLLLIGFTVPGTKFLPYIAIATLIALPIANKLAIIVGELRQIPDLGISPDNQSIPTETARAILAKIRQRFKRNLNARTAAQHIVSVFESLNARPPSAGATVGLLFLHGGAFLFAILVAIVGIAVHAQIPMHHTPLMPNQYVIAPQQLETTAQRPQGDRNVVIARFKTVEAASRAYNGLTMSQPADRIGQTLLLSFSPGQIADQRSAFRDFEKRADDVFVESASMHASVDLTFRFPDSDEGRAEVGALQLYFQGCRWNLIPPWAPDTDWPDPVRTEQTELRHIVQLLEKPPVMDVQAEAQSWKDIRDARRRGDSAEVARLEALQKQTMTAAQQAQQQKVQQQYGHDDLIQKWAAIQTEKNWKQREDRIKLEIAPLLGQQPADAPNDLLALSGYASDNSTVGVNLFCEFAHTDAGLPALMRWLFAHGAHDMHYRLVSMPAGSEELEPDEN